MNSVLDMTSGLNAALRLARGHADGVWQLSDDRGTISRSFWSIALCLPSVIGRLLMSWSVTGVPGDAAHVAGRELAAFVLGWLIFVEVTHRLALLMDRAQNWGRFIAIWNWCNVVEGVVVLVGGIPGTLGAPAILDQACALITIGWALWLEWFAAKLALGVGALTAVWLVLLDQSIGIVLASLAMLLSS